MAAGLAVDQEISDGVTLLMDLRKGFEWLEKLRNICEKFDSNIARLEEISENRQVVLKERINESEEIEMKSEANNAQVEISF
ncbi:hypothetical protein SUGI_1171780 [Cryptomeria japonica]|nr:hypothetical protein SUGI_1171780 [Cryptomeria japonica]